MRKDIVVVGGGTSGFAAAIAAARNGADVCLVERLSSLGGQMTNGLVPGMNSTRHQPWRAGPLSIASLESNFEGPQYIRGITQELIDRLVKMDGAYARIGESPVRLNFDHETAKWIIDDMVRESGATILYQSEVVEVKKSGNAVAAVTLNNGSSIEAQVFIDTTGDATVAYLAGAEYEQGRNGIPAHVQAISLYFLLGDVDINEMVAGMDAYPDDFPQDYRDTIKELWSEKKPISIVGFPSLLKKAIENGDYPVPYGAEKASYKGFAGIIRPIFRNGRIRNVTMHNVDMAYRVDPTDPDELSKAISAMGKFVVKLCACFRKYVPGYRDAYLVTTANHIGVRESRRIVGEYSLTVDEVLQGKEFPDAIGWCGHAVDVHDVDFGEEKTDMREIGGSGAYQIPYRILVPRSVDGLLVAGRCASSDRIANGTLRGQPPCMLMGQAAGTAAAISTKARVAPRNVNIAELQRQLKADGVVL
jgi:hypothetical protein